MDASLLVHCNCNLRQKLLSSELFAAVVQQQILFGSNLPRFGLRAAKLAKGRCVLGTGTGNCPWAGLWDRRGVLAARGGFAAHSSLSAVYPSTLGTAWESRACCSLLGTSSSSWKLPTSSPDIRPTGSCERLPLPLRLCFSWQLVQLRNPSGIASPVAFPVLWLHMLSPCTPFLGAWSSEPFASSNLVLLCWCPGWMRAVFLPHPSDPCVEHLSVQSMFSNPIADHEGDHCDYFFVSPLVSARSSSKVLLFSSL